MGIKLSKTIKISCIQMNNSQKSWQQHVQSSFEISIHILKKIGIILTAVLVWFLFCVYETLIVPLIVNYCCNSVFAMKID